MLVGHLTGDPQEMAARATQALAHEERLLLAECVYVLESFYEVEPTRIAEMMRAAMALRSIAVVDEAMLLRALEVYEGDPRAHAAGTLTANVLDLTLYELGNVAARALGLTGERDGPSLIALS